MWALLVVEGDPVSNHPQGVGLALKAMPMHALLLQGPYHAFDHPVLLWAVRGNELLLQAIAAYQSGVVATGEDQAIVGAKQEGLPPRRCAVPAGSKVSPRHDLQRFVIQHRLGQHLLELCVLRLQRRESLGIGHIKAAEIAAPQVEGGVAETVLKASLLDRVRAAACVRKPMICSSVKRFFISVLGLGTDST